jgi:hypothetical protein
MAAAASWVAALIAIQHFRLHRGCCHQGVVGRIVNNLSIDVLVRAKNRQSEDAQEYQTPDDEFSRDDDG